MAVASAPRAPNAGRFNWFSGVFTPSILTVLGVIMYLRLGTTTGAVGLGVMLLIVIVTHLITGATGLSISSIATNRTVGAGGAYFMISRSLGPSVGSAVGIPLFLAQALSITFYIVGFAESIHLLAPDLNVFWVATITNIVITGLSYWDASIAIKAQYFVMAAIAVSLVSFFMGTTDAFPITDIEWAVPAVSRDTVATFAIFFPAATGIMAGVSLSGDLKNPRKDIPKGTLWVILTGLLVYMAVPVWLALNFTNEDLRATENVMGAVAAIPPLIFVGIWGATLSSALGSVLAAPRTLQALANDGHVPKFLGRLSGGGKEPRVGTFITFLLVQAALLLGSLDTIAPILTMFFLATYGVVNLASGLETWAANPSFRPTFKVPAWISLIAGVVCFYVMSIIHLGWMGIAVVMMVALYYLSQRRQVTSTFGDARQGLWAALVREGVRHIRRDTKDAASWRPNLMILGGEVENRHYLLEVGSALVQERGLVTYLHLLEGEIEEQVAERQRLMAKYSDIFAETHPNTFFRADIVPDVYEGAVAAAQSYGLGDFEANTIMFGWPRASGAIEPYMGMLRRLHVLDQTLLLVRDPLEAVENRFENIHVWWTGTSGNGSLMLLFADLVSRHKDWARARVTVLTAVDAASEIAGAEGRLRSLLAAARLDADIRVVEAGGRDIQTVVCAESCKADLVFLGFLLPRHVQPAVFYLRMEALMKQLPRTVLVNAASTGDFTTVLFDQTEEVTAVHEALES